MAFPKRTNIESHSIRIVPRYCETDQAGVVHHSVYPVWFEMGRTELLRANGLAYKDLEAASVFFVVAELRIRYRQPARYDEKLHLETTCSKVTASKVEHTYKLTRPSDGVLLAEGQDPARPGIHVSRRAARIVRLIVLPTGTA
ncbi:MAG: acyl-CoA thioesterase [Planctomycetota bacterium]